MDEARRRCPACGRRAVGRREVCATCLAVLVDDVEGTITCRQCGQVCPARRQTCSSCLALLRVDTDDVERALVGALSTGRRLPRPPGRRPFAGGPGCSVERLAPQGGLVVCGTEGFVEADLEGRDQRALPPLACTTGGAVLFRLCAYPAAARSLVAFDHQGDPLATFLSAGGPLERQLDVRDEASAPVARLRPAVDGPGFELVETGGGVLARLTSTEQRLGAWRDDEWTLVPVGPRRPLRLLAYVALVAAAKALWGQPEPVLDGEDVAEEVASGALPGH